MKESIEKFKTRLLYTKDNWFMPLKEDLLFCMLAISNISIASYIFNLDPDYFKDKETVMSLVRVMHLDTWGILFSVVGLGLLLCAVVIKERRLKSQVLLVSCFIGVGIWTLYSMLGVQIGQNSVTTTRNMSTSIIHLILCAIQVVELWRIKLQTSNSKTM